MLITMLLLLIALALIAPRYGVDSRWRGPSRPPDPRGGTLAWLDYLRA